ncbi:NAD(P)-binding protein, partial [Escherichia coli]|nr:NAD(P)-binding protein [Escherichia coli]
ALLASGRQLYRAGSPTGKRIAVVGAGPAGLSCPHALARAGHQVTIYEARPKGGGLNEYGIAAYKVTGDIAQAELAYILAVGGITIEYGKALGRDISLAGLRADYDAVFLGLGLGGTNGLGLGDVPAGVSDAVAFIAALRQAPDKT